MHFSNTQTSIPTFAQMLARNWRKTCLIALIAIAGTAFSPATAKAIQSSKPNIVLINLDDADAEILSSENLEAHFPTLAALARRSTVFTNAHSTTPFCAPSRAALFTGQYAFNNGCKAGGESFSISNGFQGGYQRFITNGHDENELGVWMKNAGYRTMHVGKFHHDGFENTVPPGWDDVSISRGLRFFNTAKFSNIGVPSARGYLTGENTYVAHVDRDDAITALDSHFNSRPTQPFMLSLAPFAPHTPDDPDVTRMVEPRYLNYASDVRQPTDTPDYDEADFSDKPDHLQRPPLRRSEIALYELIYLSRLRSMKSVDDQLKAIFDRIQAAGKMGNTWIILSSDNGYQLGHHRMFAKKDPFHRSTNVPLMVAGPGTSRQQFANHLIAQLDICPTILQLAGAAIPASVDGKSFSSLISNPSSSGETSWQESIMIENWADKYLIGERFSLAYTAERFYDEIYVSWSNGQREYYDLNADPFQLDNQYDNLTTAQKEQMASSLRSFRRQNVRPIITMTSPERGADVSDEINFKGFMEDDSATVASLLTIKSFRTGRYFNGNFWQDEPFDFTIPGADSSGNISDWEETIGLFSETTNNIDYLQSWVRPVDDSGRTGEAVWSSNIIRDESLFARFNPTLTGKTFQFRTQQINGFMGKFPDTVVRIVVFDRQTNKYFNGTSFQDEYVQLDADLLPNDRWQKRLNLPTGSYRVFLRATSGRFFQRETHRADIRVRSFE